MPLTGKYLKYSPEITPEVFVLVWDKLKSIFPNKKIFDWTRDWSFESFKKYRYISIWGGDDDYSFGINNNRGIGNRNETTVQEILGYDPFVKENYISGIDPFIEDDFVLPDKWCIKTTKDKNGKLIGEWFDKQSRCRCYHDTCLGEYYNSYNLLNESIILEGNLAASFASSRIREEYTEITFDQFKKYVLKESIETLKETNPEYVECINAVTPNTRVGEIFKCRHSNKCFEFEYNDKSKENFNSWDGWSVSWSTKIPQKYFKPSTKEVFDAQNNPIEKWSVGSYVVFLKDNLQNNGRKKGDVSKITKIRKDTIEFEDNIGNNIDGEFSVVTNLKWFATKTEAEEFAKTLKPKKLLSLNNWYQSGNHIVYLYERNKVYGFHHDKWFTSEGFGENDLKYVDSNTVEEKFTNYIKNNYLIGKSFIDLVNKIDFQIKSYDLNFGNKTTQIYIPVEPNDLRGNKTARIFDKGIWAEHSSTKSNKQAVHCTTQEEWDFANDIHQSSLKADFKDFKDKTVLRLDFKNAYADVLWAETNGYQILSFQEWCDLNGYKMEKEVKFEVGKWYKNSDKSYAKCKSSDIPNVFSYEEWIIDGEFEYHKNKWYGHPYMTIASLEEIQQYLPDGHPDKIKSNQEFKDGDWVVYYVESKKSHIQSFKLNDIIQVIDGKANGNVPFIGVADITNCFRHATPEEINNHLISIGQIPSENHSNLGLFEPSRQVFASYELGNAIKEKWNNRSAVEYGNKIHEDFFKTVNPCSEVFIEQSIGRLDRSNKMILSIDDGELPMVSVVKTNSIKQLLNND